MSRVAQFLTKPVPRDDLATTVAVLEDIHEKIASSLNDLRRQIQDINASGATSGDLLAFNGIDFAPESPATAIWVSPPSAATDPGTTGQIAYDTAFIYVCVATNTWRRAALSAW